MQQITVPILLEAFERQVSLDRISFIARKTDLKEVLDLVSELRKLVPEDDEEEENFKWQACHKQGTKLWRLLTRLALKNIDDESKGNARLSDFLKAATKFEDGLYGLEDYYRDHTLHSLWVYLLGDYLLRDQLKVTYQDLDWYLWNDVDDEPNWAHLKSKAREIELPLSKKVDEKKDAIWCITALCHDLGYSLSKLADINDRVEQVLKFFDLHGFDRVGYALKIEHQYLTKQFLELTVDDMRILPDPSEEDVVIKLFRDDSQYWRLCDSLERRDHGALSAFILYKLLGFFGDATLRGPAEEWGLDEKDEAIDTLIRGTILFAIAQHDFTYCWANELGSLADVLLLADEVEEFSRWPARPLMTRKSLSTLAKVSLKFDYKGQGQDCKVGIKIDYEVREEDDLKNFFMRKANKLARVYHLKPAAAAGRRRVGRPRISRFPKITSIDMAAMVADKPLTLYMDQESIKAKLPLPNRGFDCLDTCDLELIGEQLQVLTDSGSTPLREWLGLPED